MLEMNVNSPMTPAMQRATELLRQGQSVEAEEVVQAAARQAKEQFGEDSHQYEVATNDFAHVLMSVGQHARAARVLYEICARPAPADDQARRDRLTFLLNLAKAVELAGNLDAAEQVLRDGLTGRRQVYGRDHPGYAFGVEPLAALLLRRGKAAEALEMLTDAGNIYGRVGHPRIAAVLALRAEALKAKGDPRPAFADLDPLPAEVIQLMAQSVFNRVGQTDLTINRQVLADLIPVLRQRLGEDHPTTLDALAAVSNVERMLGNAGLPKVRQDAIRDILAIHDRHGRVREAVTALMGLAVAQGDAGDLDGATASYEEAASRAERTGDNALRSQVLRNHGLMLAGLARRKPPEDPAAAQAIAGRVRDAEDKLSFAVFEAEQTGEREALGRSLVALGLFLQHAGRIEEARPVIERGVGELEATHPDAVIGRSHLHAIERGEPCGCEDPNRAVLSAFREFVTARLSSEIVEGVDVARKENNDIDVKVRFVRDPSPEELQHINRVVQHAMQEFRQRILEA